MKSESERREVTTNIATVNGRIIACTQSHPLFYNVLYVFLYILIEIEPANQQSREARVSE